MKDGGIDRARETFALAKSTFRSLGAARFVLGFVAAWHAGAADAATLAPGDLLVADFGVDAIVRVDPTTGDRTIVSGAGVGSGPTLQQPRGILVEPAGQIIVTDATLQAVLRIDPATGNRTLVSNASIGTGPALAAPLGVARDAAGNLLVVDIALDAVFRIDRATGNRTIMSDATHGAGPIFGNPAVVGLDPAGRVLVGDQVLDALVQVDPASGDRTVIAGSGVGGGPAFSSPIGLAFAGGKALVADNVQAVFSVDLATGNRATVSGSGVGGGPTLLDVRGVAVGAAGVLYAVDEDLDAVLRVDGAGNRTILSDSTTGLGFAFQTPEAIARVGTIVPEPHSLILSAYGAGLWAVNRDKRRRSKRARSHRQS